MLKYLYLQFSDLELIFKDLRILFEKRGFMINWKELEKQNLDQVINTLCMISPISLEEKQMLLETKNLNYRKEKLEQIINTYLKDNFSNKTIVNHLINEKLVSQITRLKLIKKWIKEKRTITNKTTNVQIS